MDPLVIAALQKWPNVPHCYGWLGLDARGNWRMRNEYAQQHELPGDTISNRALIEFIERNYQQENGLWFFQNGPQRVYVDLAATPYIAKTIAKTVAKTIIKTNDQNPARPEEEHAATGLNFILHHAAAMPQITSVFLDTQGTMFLQSQGVLAQVDDRDLAQCLSCIFKGERCATDEEIMEFLEHAANSELSLKVGTPDGNDKLIAIQRGNLKQLMDAAGYIARPRKIPSN